MLINETYLNVIEFKPSTEYSLQVEAIISPTQVPFVKLHIDIYLFPVLLNKYKTPMRGGSADFWEF